jgi:hypothetical protein
MIFIDPSTLGSSGIILGSPVFGSLSVVIITMGRLLSVNTCALAVAVQIIKRKLNIIFKDISLFHNEFH